MISRRLVLTLLCAFGMALAGSATAAQPYTSENLFYMVGTHDSFDSFKAHAAQVSILVPAAYNIDENGVVYGGIDPRVLSIAKKNDVEVMPIIASFDQEGVHEFLNNPKARKRAIGIMLYNAKKYGYAGWQFDLENVHVTDGAAYTDFYREAATALHKHGLKISMAVVKSAAPAPESDTTGYSRFLYEDWRGAFEFKKLAKIGDFLSFMSYDQNTALTPPGPVAGIPWMKEMADYLLSLGIDPQKISFGIPTYSDHWFATYSEKGGPHSTRKEISYDAVKNLLDRYNVQPKWMDPAGVDYAYWPGGSGVFQWLFIENARSFKKKLALVHSYHFRGFSAWVLGYEDPAIWDVLKQQTTAIHY